MKTKQDKKVGRSGLVDWVNWYFFSGFLVGGRKRRMIALKGWRV